MIGGYCFSGCEALFEGGGPFIMPPSSSKFPKGWNYVAPVPTQSGDPDPDHVQTTPTPTPAPPPPGMYYILLPND